MKYSNYFLSLTIILLSFGFSFSTNSNNSNNSNNLNNLNKQTSTNSDVENSNENIPLIKIDLSNMVFLRGTVTSKSASRIVNELISLKSKEIYLYIDSPGGSVLDGLQIIQTMEALQQSGIKVYTIANNAASMAYVIHQYGTKRYVKPWSVLMQHQISLGMQGQYYNLKAYGLLIDKLHTKLLEKQAKVAGTNLQEFNDLTRHDMWLLGSESVERGFADEVINVICDFKPQSVTEVVPTFFGDVTVTYSNCPLSNKPLDIKFNSKMTSEQIKQIKNELENFNNFEKDSKHPSVLEY